MVFHSIYPSPSWFSKLQVCTLQPSHLQTAAFKTKDQPFWSSLSGLKAPVHQLLHSGCPTLYLSLTPKCPFEMRRPERNITEDVKASKFYLVKMTLSLSILPDDAYHFVGFYSCLRTQCGNWMRVCKSWVLSSVLTVKWQSLPFDFWGKREMMLFSKVLSELYLDPWQPSTSLQNVPFHVPLSFPFSRWLFSSSKNGDGRTE